jgi:L-aminopeptidase/D-esterase-like protein
MLQLDFPSLHIGAAEYREGPTGCTVFYFPEGALTAVDVRGGAYATIYTDRAKPGDVPLDAICFAGGSIYGLEATTGVSAELFAMRGYSTAWIDIALVSGAIIFDYGLRENAIYPDKALGRAALRSAKPSLFPLGAHGAGCSATVGKGLRPGYLGERSGQGGAFRQVGPTKIAVFTVVNAVGAIVDREGRVVRGNLHPETGERLPILDGIEQRLASPLAARPDEGNTTLTLVVTNQKLLHSQLVQLARLVHGSMTRAIQPFHTVYDGDVLYAATTNEVDNPNLDDIALGVLTSELAWDAVLSCVQN